MKNRRDGKRVKDLDAMHTLMPYIKPNRCDSDVFINNGCNRISKILWQIKS